MRHWFRFIPFLALALTACTSHPPPSSPPPAPVQQPPAQQPSPPPPIAPREEPVLPQASLEAGPFFTQTGLASFYGRFHAGKHTANGATFDHRDFTAAHRTLAFGTLVRVTNLANGRMVTVEITDRGPQIKTRVIDVSLVAAQALHMQKKGIARVKLEAFRQDQPGRQ
jgi:rare lipoprotein A